MRHGRTPFRRRTVAAAVAMLLALVPGPALAADGDLDTTFGDSGRVVTPYPDGAASGVALQADGAIVIAGREDGRFAVARYLADGTPDPDFGVGGLVTTPLGARGDAASAVAIQPDGRIVATGTDGGERVVVARYLTDGTLDPSFGGGDGISRTPRAAHLWGGEDLALQPNGRIVVVGTAGGSGARTAFAVARFLPNGTDDPAFGDGGRTVTPFASGRARAVALQPDGRIVVVGWNSLGLALARYLPNGSLDRTFGGDGKVGHWDVTGPPSQMFGLAVEIQPDGRILAAGGYDIFSTAIARLLPHGRLDPSFGGDGIVRTDVAGGEQAISALALQPGGRILAAGSSWPHETIEEGVPRFVMIRYLRNGSLDPSWGGDGKVATFFPGSAYAEGAALQSDGRLVVVGEIGRHGGKGFALARYLT